MRMQIKNLSGEVIRDVPGDTLRGAVLRGADLTRAVLRGADLTRADLRRADLRRADLTGADLTRAVLRDAVLRDAVLRDAVLRDAVLTRADVASIRVSLGIEEDPTLPARVLAQIEAHPETHDQGTWHSSCNTRHCVAGFFTHLSGPLGRYMDRQLGTATAARLLAWRPDCELPSFAHDATSEDVIGALRKMVECAEADAAK